MTWLLDWLVPADALRWDAFDPLARSDTFILWKLVRTLPERPLDGPRQPGRPRGRLSFRRRPCCS